MKLAVVGLPGWAARAAIMGADVRYVGPDPGPAMAHLSRVLPGLYDRTPPEGALTCAGGPMEAIEGADLVLRPAGQGPDGKAPSVTVGGPDDTSAAALHPAPSPLSPEMRLMGPRIAEVAPLLARIGLHHVDSFTELPGDETACVGTLRALRAANFGAGRLIAETEAHWPRAEPDWSGPVETADRVIPLDWADYNGHMTEARYLHAFGDATDRLMHMLGCTPAYISAGHSFFTAETHIRHLGEALTGERIRIESQAIRVEGAKMHFFHTMTKDGVPIATGEHFMLHVSLATRRPAPPEAPLDRGMGRFGAASLAPPTGAGRFVGQPR